MRPCEDKSDFIEYTHFEQRVWWITGNDSEFSRQLALAVVRHGDHVVWSAPEDATLEKLSGCFPERVVLDPLGTTSDRARVTSIFDRAVERFGRVDVLVHVDGLTRMSAVEDLDMDLLEEGLGSRLRHAVHLVRAVLPGMRERGSGHIVYASPSATTEEDAGLGLHHARRAAIEGLLESLGAETEHTGVRVTCAEVAIGPKRAELAPGVSRTYAEALGRTQRAVTGARGGSDPSAAARAIVEAVDAPLSPRRLILGQRAIERARRRLHELRDDLEVAQPIPDALKRAQLMDSLGSTPAAAE